MMVLSDNGSPISLYAEIDAELDFEQRVMIHVPPFGFDVDEKASAGLVHQIRGRSTTLLVMAVGAPRSEIFVESHRHLLPSFWAICVGQAVEAFAASTRNGFGGFSKNPDACSRDICALR